LVLVKEGPLAELKKQSLRSWGGTPVKKGKGKTSERAKGSSASGIETATKLAKRNVTKARSGKEARKAVAKNIGSIKKQVASYDSRITNLENFVQEIAARNEDKFEDMGMGADRLKNILNRNRVMRQKPQIMLKELNDFVAKLKPQQQGEVLGKVSELSTALQGALEGSDLTPAGVKKLIADGKGILAQVERGLSDISDDGVRKTVGEQLNEVKTLLIGFDNEIDGLAKGLSKDEIDEIKTTLEEAAQGKARAAKRSFALKVVGAILAVAAVVTAIIFLATGVTAGGAILGAVGFFGLGGEVWAEIKGAVSDPKAFLQRIKDFLVLLLLVMQISY